MAEFLDTYFEEEDFDVETIHQEDASKALASEIQWKQFAKHPQDTGSPEVQIAISTARILHISAHLKVHKKDKHSQRGLMALVNHRKSMMSYLRRHNPESFYHVMSTLGLRIKNQNVKKYAVTKGRSRT